MAQTTDANVNIIKEDNEFVLVVKKRLRNYKKKMNNIISIEAKVAKKENIIKEQEDALKSKEAIAKIIQELEHVETQLLEVKQSESQKHFSLDDVKVLITLLQTQGQVKKVEGVTDQQLKHVQSSANSILRPSSKWSIDDTAKHALKLVRDSSLKTTLAKLAVQETKHEVVPEKPVVVEPAVAPAPVAPVESTPAPSTNEPPKEVPSSAPASTSTVAESPTPIPAPTTTPTATTTSEAPKESEEQQSEGRDKDFRGGHYRGHRKPRGSGGDGNGGNNERNKPRNNTRSRGSGPRPHNN